MESVAQYKLNWSLYFLSIYAAPIHMVGHDLPNVCFYAVNCEGETYLREVDLVLHALTSLWEVLNRISLSKELDPLQTDHDEVAENDEEGDSAAPRRPEEILPLVEKVNFSTEYVETLKLFAKHSSVSFKC